MYMTAEESNGFVWSFEGSLGFVRFKEQQIQAQNCANKGDYRKLNFFNHIGVKNNYYQKRDYDMEDAFYWWIYTRPYLVWTSS